MRIRVCSSLIVPTIILFATLALAAASSEPSGHAVAQGGPAFALDMDITDGGPCADIDSSARHAAGQSFGVGVCALGMTQTQVGAFSFRLIYDPGIDFAPPIDCEMPDRCADANPDANAGFTVWGGGLGEGFDCSGVGLAPPAVRGGRAYLACNSVFGPYYPMGDPMPLGVVSFQAAAGGVDVMRVEFAEVGDKYMNRIAWCDDTTCPSGSVENSGSQGSDGAVGGLAELPDAETTKSSRVPQFPTMAALGVLALAFVGGGWYARRRRRRVS